VVVANDFAVLPEVMRNPFASKPRTFGLRSELLTPKTHAPPTLGQRLLAAVRLVNRGAWSATGSGTNTDVIFQAVSPVSKRRLATAAAARLLVAHMG
jgi:hypothetical protein